ncbi:MAG: helix-turn-helix domain-containing protein [Spirosomataceae bacterium]
MEIIKPIKTEEDYEQALKKIESIFHAQPNTPEGDKLEVISLLVHEYEQKHYSIEPLSPLEALKFEMEERGMTQTRLAQNLGMSKSTISEILNGKKQMSLNVIKFLHNELGIPAHILLAY